MNKICKTPVKDTNDEGIIINYCNDFKGVKKCLYCQELDIKHHSPLCQNCGFFCCNKLIKNKSHILMHLNQCKHKTISIAPFTNELKCDQCKDNDAYKLKFFKGNETISFLCDRCDDGKKHYQDLIIDNKKISEELLPISDIPPLANRDDDFLDIFINKKNIKIKSLNNSYLFPASLSYPNKKIFCSLQINFLNHEIETVEEENEKEPSFAFNLKFREEEFGFLAEVISPENPNSNFKFNKGQVLIIEKEKKITDNSFNLFDDGISSTSDDDYSVTNSNKIIDYEEEIEEEYKFIGKVIVKGENNRILIACKGLKKNHGNGTYLIKEKYITGSEQKMINGLKRFENNTLMDKDIELLILGIPGFSIENKYFNSSDIPEDFSIKEFPDIKLNESQKEFIKKCYTYKFNLLQGPPGTGKSMVLAFLTYYFNKSKKKQNHKIIICAPSNQAVDNISILLQKLNIKFVRVLSSSKELKNENDKTNSLLDLAKKEIYKDKTKNKKIIELIEKREKYKDLSKYEEIEYKQLMNDFESKIIEENDIILSTINNSSDERLKRFCFSIVIIDEATQAKEADNFLPLIHNAEVVVLIGDQKQLGPTVISEEAYNAGYYISQFERLVNLYRGSCFISILNEQYRMNEFLYRFSNKYFYENKMITRNDNKLDENVMMKLPFPDKIIPSFFYHHTEKEKEENNSYYNENEINKALYFSEKLIEAGVNPKDIGIITLYNAQKFRLIEKFQKSKNNEDIKNIKISSVDGFQGMEKKYIIISTVRSNNCGNIGFSKNEKRLNVALTRGKKGVIILGNCACLSKRPSIWRKFISFYYDNKLIIKDYLTRIELVKREDVLLNMDEDMENEENEKREFFREMRYNKAPEPLVVNYKQNLNKKEDNIINENKINIIKNENKQEIKDLKKKNGNINLKNEKKEDAPKAKKKKSDKKQIQEKRINKDDKRKRGVILKDRKEKKKEKKNEDKKLEDEKKEDEKEEDEKEEQKEKRNKKEKISKKEKKGKNALNKNDQKKENNKNNNKQDKKKEKENKKKGKK